MSSKAKSSQGAVAQKLAASRFGAWTIVHVLARIDPRVMEASGGRLSTMPNKPIMLLQHKGARTGLTHVTALQYATEGSTLYVVAANGGSTRNPDWYLNLKANPVCGVLARHHHGQYVAEELHGSERARGWELLLAIFGGYETWQARAPDRPFPVLALDSFS